MELSFDGGTARQRQWVSAAVSRCTYPFDTLDASVVVSWPDEPSCPGHKEYACTHGAGGTYYMEIRRTFDTEGVDPDGDPVGQNFYQETVVHELMHVVAFDLAIPSSAAAFFYKEDASGNRQKGTAADMNPLGKPWEDRIQEAVAETLKDIFLADQYREYDNRTNWTLDQAFYDNFMAYVGMGGASGSSSFHQAGLFPPVSLEYTVEYNPPGNGAGMYIAASHVIPDSIPDGAGLYLSDWAHVAVSASGFTTGILSGFYAYLIEAPAGHGPPTHLADDWDVQGSLEAQGFTSGDWDGHWVQGWPWHPDNSKERYVFVRQIWVGAGASTEESTVITMGDIEAQPLLEADKAGVVGQPDPPPWPYTPVELNAGAGSWASVRFKSFH